MKILVNREQLSEALSNLQRAVTPRSSLPILEGVLLSAETDRLTLMAYNMEISIKKELPIRCEKEGDVVISAKILFDIIRKVKGDIIEFEVDERQVCHIKCGGSAFDILGMKSEDFPEMPNVAEKDSINISSEILKDMVRQTIFAISIKEDARPILTGIKFEIQNNEIKLVAINGNCLAIRKAPIRYEGNMSFVVSGRAIGEAVKIIGEKDEDIKINIGTRNISFDIDGYVMTSRLIEGNFIEYQRSIPNSYKQEIKINVPKFIETLERISLVILNEQTKTPIRFSMEKDRILLTCSSAIGRSNDVYQTNLEGEEFEIGFNSKNLLDALKAVESEEAIIRFNGSAAAAAIYPIDGEEFLYLVMPMLLK
ncbi:MAG: DNA polymerase III subunit beta [Acutalibacteraceae bacterium]|nr:DNA polymerase III subunit beta [Acutalibacteraceae bacterium]